jgi:hypothetical protein
MTFYLTNRQFIFIKLCGNTCPGLEENCNFQQWFVLYSIYTERSRQVSKAFLFSYMKQAFTYSKIHKLFITRDSFHCPSPITSKAPYLNTISSPENVSSLCILLQFLIDGKMSHLFSHGRRWKSLN